MLSFSLLMKTYKKTCVFVSPYVFVKSTNSLIKKKVKGKSAPRQFMKAYSGVELQLHSVVISTINIANFTLATLSPRERYPVIH